MNYLICCLQLLSRQTFAIWKQPIYAFMQFFLPVLRTILFPGNWLLSLIIKVQYIESERGINPVPLSSFNPWKEYLRSLEMNQRHPSLKSCMEPTVWSRLVEEIFPNQQTFRLVYKKVIPKYFF